MDNILYKAFGKRIYKALLNLVGGGNSGGGNTSGDVRTLVVDIVGDADPLLVRQSDKVIFTSITQEVIDALANNPESLNFLEEDIARNKHICDFIIECVNDNKVPQVYYRIYADENNYAILGTLSTIFERIGYSSYPEGIVLSDRTNDYLYGIISGTYEGDKFVMDDVPLTPQDMG